VHKLLGSLSPVDILSKFAPEDENSTSGPTTVGNTLRSIKRVVDIPPIHVDHVGEAVCEAIAREDVSGPLNVWDMRKLLGWTDSSSDHSFKYREASH
jgi:hypothetical protein